METLVLGIGNLLLGDEGVGVHAAWRLKEAQLQGQARVLEVGTAILHALPALEEADRLIVIDAIKADGAPGTLYRVPLEDCHHAPVIASMHGFDLSRVLSLAGRNKPLDGLVLGVEPSRMGWSMELSPEVSNALPHLVEAVKKELHNGQST